MTRLGVALAALLLVSTAQARTELPVELQRGAQARITVSSPFDQLPSAGYAPVDIKIENNSTAPQIWDFDFTNSRYGAVNAITSHTQLAVPAKSSRTFRLTIPLALAQDAYGSPLNVRVSGNGAGPMSTVQFPPLNRAGAHLTPFVAMSESIASRLRGALEQELKPAKAQLAASVFRPDELPEDWRTLVGFAGLWMTADEVARLNAAQRGALHDWVHRGGRLFVIGDSAAVAALPEIGFGGATAMPEDPTPDEMASMVNSLAPTLETRLSDEYTRGTGWAARHIVGELAVNVPLLVGFMVIFAAVSGPANLFWFAPVGQRHRLFWTTPAISLVAGVLLALLIVFQDGFGGNGYRLALVHVIPSERKQVVLQEQIARTGVLRRSAFTTADPTFIAAMKTDPRRGERDEVFNAGRQFEGWFKSRTLQAHWLETITSTRAEVALLNAEETRTAAAPPVILSSIDAPLEELYYYDEQRRMWQAKNVRPGEKITLEPSTVDLLFPLEAGTRLRAMWEKIWPQPGHFYAKSSAPGPLIDTLRSIDWEDQDVVYFGAISTAAPTP